MFVTSFIEIPPPRNNGRTEDGRTAGRTTGKYDASATCCWRRRKILSACLRIQNKPFHVFKKALAVKILFRIMSVFSFLFINCNKLDHTGHSATRNKQMCTRNYTTDWCSCLCDRFCANIDQKREKCIFVAVYG